MLNSLNFSREDVSGGEELLRSLRDKAKKIHNKKETPELIRLAAQDAVSLLYDVAEGRQMDIQEFLDPLMRLACGLTNAERRKEERPFGDLVRELLRKFPEACQECRNDWILLETHAKP